MTGGHASHLLDDTRALMRRQDSIGLQPGALAAQPSHVLNLGDMRYHQAVVGVDDRDAALHQARASLWKVMMCTDKSLFEGVRWAKHTELRASESVVGSAKGVGMARTVTAMQNVIKTLSMSGQVVVPDRYRYETKITDTMVFDALVACPMLYEKIMKWWRAACPDGKKLPRDRYLWLLGSICKVLTPLPGRDIRLLVEYDWRKDARGGQVNLILFATGMYLIAAVWCPSMNPSNLMQDADAERCVFLDDLYGAVFTDDADVDAAAILDLPLAKPNPRSCLRRGPKLIKHGAVSPQRERGVVPAITARPRASSPPPAAVAGPHQDIPVLRFDHPDYAPPPLARLERCRSARAGSVSPLTSARRGSPAHDAASPSAGNRQHSTIGGHLAVDLQSHHVRRASGNAGAGAAAGGGDDAVDGGVDSDASGHLPSLTVGHVELQARPTSRGSFRSGGGVGRSGDDGGSLNASLENSSGSHAGSRQQQQQQRGGPSTRPPAVLWKEAPPLSPPDTLSPACAELLAMAPADSHGQRGSVAAASDTRKGGSKLAEPLPPTVQFSEDLIEVQHAPDEDGGGGSGGEDLTAAPPTVHSHDGPGSADTPALDGASGAKGPRKRGRGGKKAKPHGTIEDNSTKREDVYKMYESWRETNAAGSAGVDFSSDLLSPNHNKVAAAPVSVIVSESQGRPTCRILAPVVQQATAVESPVASRSMIVRPSSTPTALLDISGSAGVLSSLAATAPALSSTLPKDFVGYSRGFRVVRKAPLPSPMDVQSSETSVKGIKGRQGPPGEVLMKLVLTKPGFGQVSTRRNVWTKWPPRLDVVWSEIPKHRYTSATHGLYCEGNLVRNNRILEEVFRYHKYRGVEFTVEKLRGEDAR